MKRRNVTSLDQSKGLKARMQREAAAKKSKDAKDAVKKSSFTVEDKIRNKIEKVKRWEKANPGLTWSNPEHETKEPKIYIPKEMLQSKVYRSLSRVGMLLLQDFFAKRIMKRAGKKRWLCENNGEIIYSYTEALEKGFSRDHFRNGIDELQAKGFLDITHKGQGGRKPAKGCGDCTKYWIDDRWKEYGSDDFKPARKPRKKDERKGRGWSVFWKAKTKKVTANE